MEKQEKKSLGRVCRRVVDPFPFVSLLRREQEDGVQSSRTVEQQKPSPSATPPILAGALGALVGYGSDSDGSDVNLTTAGALATAVVTPATTTTTTKTTTALQERNEAGRDETTKGKKGRAKKAARGRKKRLSAKASKEQSQVVIRRGPSLLRKLLETGIRREQNALLQCIRHIVSKNFFEGEKEEAARRRTGGDEVDESGGDGVDTKSLL